VNNLVEGVVDPNRSCALIVLIPSVWPALDKIADFLLGYAKACFEFTSELRVIQDELKATAKQCLVGFVESRNGHR
jgi:hypothetical protein